MDYTLEQIDNITDSLEFAQWLHNEGFINIADVHCGNCGSVMRLQGGTLFS